MFQARISLRFQVHTISDCRCQPSLAFPGVRCFLCCETQTGPVLSDSHCLAVLISLYLGFCCWHSSRLHGPVGHFRCGNFAASGCMSSHRTDAHGDNFHYRCFRDFGYPCSTLPRLARGQKNGTLNFENSSRITQMPSSHQEDDNSTDSYSC